MSELLYITLEAEQPGRDWEQRIADGVRSQAGGERRNELRLVFRREQYGLSVEPFFAGASFAALVRDKRKVSAVTSAMRAILGECFRYADGIGILVHSESDIPSTPLNETTVSLEDALNEMRARRNTWLKLLAPLRTFYISRVEARLYQPISIDTGDIATHYFRDYTVLATNLKHVKQLLIEDLAGDGAAFVGWGAVDIDAVHQSNEDPSVTGRRGRVYFAK